jgi:signal transduction histidine kinase
MQMGDDDPDVAEQLREALRFLAHAAREGHSSTLALLELHGVEPMAASELAQRIERNARRSLLRIDDFVVFARARSQPLKTEELDLLDLLFDAVAEAWHDGNERGVRLKVIDAPDEALLQADRSLLRPAVARLLQHALERARRGSELACTVRDAPLVWSLEIDEVPGSGAATPPGATAPPAVESEHGWALVELVARRMGGAVSQWDEPGHGVRLRVTLPRA